MDGGIICRNGVDIVVYFAGNDSQYSDSWFVVYSGRWIVLHDWCYILSVAADEIFACGVALVRNRGQCVFLFRRPVWVYIGFVKGVQYGI